MTKFLLYLHELQQQQLPLKNVYGLELLLVMLATVVACLAPRFGRRTCARIEKPMRRIAARPATAILIVAAVPVAIRLLLLPLMPVPQPAIHDEFSHLLAADTFALGRLVNPSPHCWEHFESFHITVMPVYISMEPPLKGMVLAAGQVLFHSPWVGVLIEVALMSASCTWMLYGWTRPYWAFTGGLLLALRFGVFSYWGNSYWGGALAAAGGGLVLGALPRLRRKPSVANSFLLGVGSVILAGTRPFEGLILCLAAAGIFMVALIRRQLRLAFVASQIVVPVLLAVIPWLGWNLYYNQRTTGNPLKMAHEENRARYAVAPYWIWQPLRPVPYYNHQVMREFYIKYEADYVRGKLANSQRLLRRQIAAKFRDFIYFFFTPALLLSTMVLFCVTPFRMLWTPAALLGASFVGWFASTSSLLPHYAAPVTSVVIALSVMGLRRIRIWRRDRRGTGRSLSRWLMASTIFMCMIKVCTLCWPQLLPAPTEERWVTWADTVGGNGFRRAAMLKELSTSSSLVFVRYSADHYIHDEWVYNEANIPKAAIILARDMGPEANRCVIEAYAGRTLWLLQPDLTPPQYSLYTER
jgi:hypothetical protein